MTEQETKYDFPSHDDEGWVAKTKPIERVEAVDWDTQKYVVGVVLEVSEINVSKTDEPDPRLCVDLQTEGGVRRVWANTMTRDFIAEVEPGQFIMIRYLGDTISKNGNTYKQFECFTHDG